MKVYSIAIMVRNEFGVLNRVTSMFRRRQFNITCLTVSETETEELSRITVQFEGDTDRAKDDQDGQDYSRRDHQTRQG